MHGRLSRQWIAPKISLHTENYRNQDAILNFYDFALLNTTLASCTLLAEMLRLIEKKFLHINKISIYQVVGLTPWTAYCFYWCASYVVWACNEYINYWTCTRYQENDPCISNALRSAAPVCLCGTALSSCWLTASLILKQQRERYLHLAEYEGRNGLGVGSGYYFDKNGSSAAT